MSDAVGKVAFMGHTSRTTAKHARRAGAHRAGTNATTKVVASLALTAALGFGGIVASTSSFADAGATPTPTSSSGSSDVVPSKPYNFMYARTYGYLHYGWSTQQYVCLRKVWAKESNWRTMAHNRRSGAYGIPQAMPGRKMANEGRDWKTNAATQIRWGLKYIKGAYGTPCHALYTRSMRGWS